MRNIKVTFSGTSLVVQWLRLCTSTEGSMGLIPGWELISHMLHGEAKINKILISSLTKKKVSFLYKINMISGGIMTYTKG